MKPAGMVEVLAGDGLGAEDWSRIRDITVTEANLFGVAEVYRDFAVQDEDGGSPMHGVDPVRMDQVADKLVRIRL